MKTLDPKLVESFLAARQNKFVTVSFLKVNGEVTTKNGQLKATSRLVGNARGAAQSEAMAARGQKWMALPNGKSASFYLDRVTEIRAEGARLSARD